MPQMTHLLTWLQRRSLNWGRIQAGGHVEKWQNRSCFQRILWILFSNWVLISGNRRCCWILHTTSQVPTSSIICEKRQTFLQLMWPKLRTPPKDSITTRSRTVHRKTFDSGINFLNESLYFCLFLIAITSSRHGEVKFWHFPSPAVEKISSATERPGGGRVWARGENGLPRSWHDNVSVCDWLSGYELNLKQSWETAASCE